MIAEIVDTFTDVAWHEAGLTTQSIKNRIYVQPSARAGWVHFLDYTPRDPAASLPIHDIPDGSSLTDPDDHDNMRIWPEDDGINIIGTPLGSPDLVESYLFGKGVKHRQLLSFITKVADFPREAVAMFKGAAGPRLSRLLKSVEKNPSTERCMHEMDSALVSTKLQCLTSSPDLEHSLGPTELDMLTEWLDLPPLYGGSGLNSLSRSIGR